MRIRDRAGDLRGKLAGAVGAYNATSLLVKDPLALEREFLDGLGLAPSEHSTQLVEPEYLLRLLLEINMAFGVIANLADDLRNLQRSEIGEVREEFTATQVGSSTMPQKRNPWNSEHVKSLWKAFCPARDHLLHGPDLRAPAGPDQLRLVTIRCRLPGGFRPGRRPHALGPALPGRGPRADGGEPRRDRETWCSPSPSTSSSALGGDPEAHERIRVGHPGSGEERRARSRRS